MEVRPTSRRVPMTWTAITAVLLLLQSQSSGAQDSNHTEDTPPVPAVFKNGAWDPDRPTTLNAYVSAVLSKDVYVKHVVDPRNGARARRNFTVFATLFCRSMAHLGAEDCEPVSGYGSLVWAVVRAGPSVLLVFRGSNTPQNWIADVASFRMVNVADFGGGSSGTNVAAGFYRVFAMNRQSIVQQIKAAMVRAEAAAAAVQPGGGDGDGDGGGGRGGKARLWVFGHSLGGAVALMAASYLDVREGLTASGVYTFGCPRVGDTSWASAYRLGGVTQRLENTGDIIPTLPFGTTWRHVGGSTTLQGCGAAVNAGVDASDRTDAASGSDDETATTDAGTSTSGSQDALAQALSVLKASKAATNAAKSTASGRADAIAQAEAAEAEAVAIAASRRLLLLRPAAGGRSADSVGADVVESESDADLYDDEVEADADLYDAGFMLKATAAADGRQVRFPFPVSLRDHYIQTYVEVMWSCLPGSDQDMVPGPEDVYGPVGVYGPEDVYGSEDMYAVEEDLHGMEDWA